MALRADKALAIRRRTSMLVRTEMYRRHVGFINQSNQAAYTFLPRAFLFIKKKDATIQNVKRYK